MGRFKGMTFTALLCVIGILGALPVPPAAGQVRSYPLTVEEATRLALENNFEVQLARFDAQIAATQQGVEESIYDTILNADVRYHNDQSARTSTLLGSKDVDNDYNVSLSKKTPSGTTVTVDMTNNRSWTNSPFATLNPAHESSLGVSVEQELGRNFFGIQDRGRIKITLLDIENADYTSQEKIEQSLARAQVAYWDLVLAVERRRIGQDMLEQAKKLLDLQKEKLEVGLVEAPEVFAAEANYKNRLSDLALADSQVETAHNALKLLLNIEDETVRLQPADTFRLGSEDVTLKAAMERAFANRRDYKIVSNDIKAKGIKVSMKKNNVWPEINLSASFSQNGLGDHFKQAVTNITDQSNPELTAALSISFPLENTKARAELDGARLEKARALTRMKLIERTIAIDIIDQVRTCNVNKTVAAHAEDVVKLQRKKLEAEEERFSRGRSDTDTVIRFQEDLLRARLNAAAAKQRYHVSLVNLKVKEGSLLGEYLEKKD